MSQDPLERAQLFLSKKRVNPLVLLLDLTTLLPASLLQRALWLAQNASEGALQAFLVHALAKRLPTKNDRLKLTNKYLLPAGRSVDEVSVPEGKEAKRLIGKLSEKQRFQVFDQLLRRVEPRKSAGKSSDVNQQSKDSFRRVERNSRPPKPKLVDDDFGGVASVDPPDNLGGSSTSSGGGFEAVDAGFESVGGSEPQDTPGFEAVNEGFESRPSKPHPSSGTSTEKEKRPDYVNLGFSQRNAADKKVQKTEPLQRGRSYYFWLKIGKEKDEAAIGKPAEFDLDLVPAKAVLTVAIFGFENELAITPGQDIGELRVEESEVKVKRQPLDTKSISLSAEAPQEFLERHLLFPITVPDKEATHRLRCNIYCEQVLVQSYVVSANVKAASDPVTEACSQQLDYVLSESLRASHLAKLTEEPHLLSLMVNDNGDGSSTFRFFGSDGSERYKDDAPIDGPQLTGFLQQARAALRKVSWGDEEEWDEKKRPSYRYQDDNTFDERKLAKDLAYLARAGSRIYTGFQSHLRKKRSELEALLANTGLIQIALKFSPRAVLPAAVVYDYAWNPNQFSFPNTTFELCPSFSKALNEARNGGPPLEDCVCFKGGCELKAMTREIVKTKTLNALGPIICPSGFWGYRHLLGLPLTLGGEANTDISPVIEFKDSLQMFACVSTDKDFEERDPHLDRLKALQGLKFERDDGYDPFILRLKAPAVPQIIYFYCHGGVKAGSNNPFLQIGEKDELDPNNWGGEGIEWSGPNPLVFINGCHTTSLNPEVTLDFVSSFVRDSGASGVIGTEITIFEPLAVKFAEECFKRFIGAPPHKEKMPIGKAVRGARLELLRQGNPLGLVYIPYAVASLRLQEKQN